MITATAPHLQKPGGHNSERQVAGQTYRAHEQRRGVTSTGRRSHAHQSETKTNVQTLTEGPPEPFPRGGEPPSESRSTYPALNREAFAGSRTPTRPVACVPSPSSSLLKLTSLGAAARTSPAAARRRRALLVRATKNTTQKHPKTHLSFTLQDTPVVLTSRVTAADHSSCARRSGSGACAVPPRRASCRGGCVRLRSICPAVTRSARFARDV